VTDGHVTDKVTITVGTSFKSGDRIQAQCYRIGRLLKALFISKYSVMDTGRNMTPAAPAFAYRGVEKHEHAILCQALQTRLEDAFHPTYAKEAMVSSRL
jgi:hypothetical protein